VLRISPFPLQVNTVPLPDGYSFVVCNSLVTTVDRGRAVRETQSRIVECRLGVAMLGSLLGDRLRSGRELTMLGALRYWPNKARTEAVEMLPDGPVTIAEVARMIGMSVSRLKESALRHSSGEPSSELRGGYKVKQRVRHVLSEGSRVDLAAKALRSGDVEEFGRLMDESHKSYARDYEISTPELDALVEICREEKALGARLTGSGFGGCVVALVRDSDLPHFVPGVVERYYHDYLPSTRREAGVSVVALEDAVFACKPCSGARMLM
jgi:N-acetylgalactosamine kinase